MIGPTEQVYKVPSWRNSKPRLHVDPECHRLRYAKGTLSQYRRDEFPEDYPECPFCTDRVEQPHTHDLSAQRALKQAAMRGVADD